MNLRRLNIEITLYILALVLALSMRLLNLGVTQLSDGEAGWALQALQVAHPNTSGERPAFGPQPAYVFLTGATFIVFGDSNFAARFWPALTGSLLVLLPCFFRRELGRLPRLILAYGLALDPGLVTISRMIGSPIMALSFGLLALGFWNMRKPILAGILGGLALLSGPAAITGLLGLAITWVVFKLAHRPAFIPDQDSPVEAMPRPALISVAATVLLAGTLFFRYPQGLAAWAETLTAYLQGWASSSVVPASRLIAALLIYEIFPVLFTLVGILRWLVGLSRESGPSPSWPIQSLVWGLIGLVLVLLYPAHQVADLAWVLVPIWVLAAGELGSYLPDFEANPVSLVEAAVLFILSALFWNTLISTSQLEQNPGLSSTAIRLGMLVGILGLAVLTILLVYLGWSWKISRNGLIWGGLAILSFYSISVLWGASQLRLNAPEELWSQPPATDQSGLFTKTLHDLSNWTTGFPQTIDIVSTVDSPSLRWVLRNYTHVRFLPELPVGELPGIIVTRQEESAPALAAAYRGQDFVWWLGTDWMGALPPDFIAWFTYRIAPTRPGVLILWARSDLFPGGVLGSQVTP
jgi:hypothetical protein